MIDRRAVRSWCGAFGAVLITIVLAAEVVAGALPSVVDGQPLPTLAPMLERVMPAVVNISTRSEVVVREHPLLRDPFFRRFFGVPDGQRRRQSQSLGSGVVVDAEAGLIVTNDHVIRGADAISVSLHDGSTLEARLVGTDPNTDIAVIQVPAEGLTTISLADSDLLRVGDFVVAIGNPFGLGQTATSGIVSALGRSGLGIEDYEDFIQTDASINTGNSGGALVNLNGELVGINTAILAPSGGNVGIGFAIPSNMAQKIMTQLVRYGRVRRGLLGVALQDVTLELAEIFGLGDTRGTVVVQIQHDSPAAHVGVQPGDVIVAINNESIESTVDAHNALGLMQVGDQVLLEVIRDGQRILLEAALAEPMNNAIDAGELIGSLGGAMLSDIAPSSPFYGRIQGVVVSSVEPGSPAQAAGIREHDVITAANRVRVRNLQIFREVLSRSGRTLMLRLQRGSSSVFVLIQ